MRIFLFLLSLTFIGYGFLPYKKVNRPNTAQPNQLIVQQQECGCPCPNGSIIKGSIIIPADTLAKYPKLLNSQVNLQMTGFNQPYNYELGQAVLYVTGQLVGVDTILCDPNNCEIVPRFKVDSWALVDSVATVWMLPKWAVLLFAGNLFFFFPALSILSVYRFVKKRRQVKLG